MLGHLDYIENAAIASTGFRFNVR